MFCTKEPNAAFQKWYHFFHTMLLHFPRRARFPFLHTLTSLFPLSSSFILFSKDHQIDPIQRRLHSTQNKTYTLVILFQHSLICYSSQNKCAFLKYAYLYEKSTFKCINITLKWLLERFMIAKIMSHGIYIQSLEYVIDDLTKGITILDGKVCQLADCEIESLFWSTWMGHG